MAASNALSGANVSPSSSIVGVPIATAPPQLYRQAVIDDVPAAYYRLGDRGAVAADSSGNGHDATVSGPGTGIIQNTPSLVTTDAVGSTTFKGNVLGHIVAARNAAFEPAGAVTVEAWANVQSPIATAAADIAGYGNRGYRLRFDKALSTFAFSVNVGSGSIDVPAATAWPLTGRHHVVGTFDGATASIYLDGVLRGSASATGPIVYSVATQTDAFVIGNDVTADAPASGAIQEVALYPRALLAATIAHHYAVGTASSGATPTPEPSATPTYAPTPTPTPSATATPTPSPTPTAKPSATPTPKPSATPTAAPSPTPKPTPTPTPTPTHTPSPSPSPSNILLPPAGSIYLGARVQPLGGGTIAQLETQIGRKFALDDEYDGWADNFPGAPQADDYANGRYPVVAWNCGYPNVSVASGAHDADIIAAATRIKAYGHPIFLRWFWEFNLNDSSNGGRPACYDPQTDAPNGYFSPTQFVAAWRHIHDVFVAQHVTNVIWFWCASSGGTGPAATAYYPGAAYVDWIGFDGYATGATQTFASTFSTMYAQMQSLSTTKPILISETGAVAANQVNWLQGANATLQSTFPQIKGWMYFDVYKSTDRSDWSLTTTQPAPDGMTQFRVLANTPYMGAAARQ